MISIITTHEREVLEKRASDALDLTRRCNELINKLTKKINAIEEGKSVRYVQVDYKNEGDQESNYENGDAAYQEWVSSLLDDSRFQWLIYKRQMAMIDVMRAIPTNDPKSAEMRQRAAYRMDGIQMLLDDMVAMKRAYKLSQLPKDEAL